MAASKIPKALTLKQFLLRQQVLSLYRDIQRSLRRVPNKKDRDELRVWAREEFKKNKKEKDEIVIRMLLTQGKRTLQEIQSTVILAR
ncbi:LYR motif-containing protein 2-like [Acanthaster planci]|uniref:LYR motif-containing protein 2-like n=1 Tax=Acanthaster planci TaxID=133434 RepID=A0A8B7YE88_ACAPL|nr:LYR motif-containing protein 2-like [Acanthaster planci]